MRVAREVVLRASSNMPVCLSKKPCGLVGMLQVTVYGQGTGGHIACILGASPQAQVRTTPQSARAS